MKSLSLAAPRKDEQSDTLGRENRVFSGTPHTVGLIMLSAGLQVSFLFLFSSFFASHSFYILSSTFNIFLTCFSDSSLFHLQHGQQLYRHIYLGCKEEDNVHKNFELLFTTLAILTIELANEEVVIDLIRLAIALQVTLVINLYRSQSYDSVEVYYKFFCAESCSLVTSH